MRFRLALIIFSLSICFSLLNAVVKVPADGIVRYSQFGAKGDGKTDDIDAIAEAHRFANEHNLPVRADDGATYYIGGKDRVVIIQTDTNFGTAKFVIDDTDVQNRRSNVFVVKSKQRIFRPEGITSLQKGQEKINISLPGPSLIRVTDSGVKRYIRFGANRNSGSSQTDVFVVDKDGNVDTDAPIIWDFDQITDIVAYPIDEETLTISGGHFTTIANRAESKYTYYSRGIMIQRSNVLVDGLEHHIIGEGDHGAPYTGFLNVADCAYVTIQNAVLTGRKTYQTIGSAGTTVSMGSYGISLSRALNVSFVNCRQTNDINDIAFWGIMGSNYCKNLLLDACSFSRFDAHMGVVNVTILNSMLGHQGINAIGSGTLVLENSTVRSRHLINLRPDYGSTWEGEIIIRDSVFIPSHTRLDRVSLIGGSNSGKHDFGYVCYMPERIAIFGLRIDDARGTTKYEGPTVFADFNKDFNDNSYVEAFPFIKTKEVLFQDVISASGKPLRLSENSVMFEGIELSLMP